MLTSGQSCSQLHRLFFCPRRYSTSYSEVTKEFFCLRSHMDVQGATIFVCMAQSFSSSDDVTAGGALLLLLLLVFRQTDTQPRRIAAPHRSVTSFLSDVCSNSVILILYSIHFLTFSVISTAPPTDMQLCNCFPLRARKVYFLYGTIQTQGNPKHLKGTKIHQELHLNQI